MTLGPGQPQLHSFETKVCSLDSLWARAECYLGVCACSTSRISPLAYTYVL